MEDTLLPLCSEVNGTGCILADSQLAHVVSCPHSACNGETLLIICTVASSLKGRGMRQVQECCSFSSGKVKHTG
jgi:hypothetical protein